MSCACFHCEVAQEYRAASDKFEPFNSTHEGYAVILEEVEELKREVFWGHKGCTDRHHRKRMRAEAVQVAAMALRFLNDCCQEPDAREPTP